MRNEHVELVKKWLEDNSSVSLQALEASSSEAALKEVNAATRTGRTTEWVAAYAAEAAANAARSMAIASAHSARAAAGTTRAADWINEYEELTNGK